MAEKLYRGHEASAATPIVEDKTAETLRLGLPELSAEDKKRKEGFKVKFCEYRGIQEILSSLVQRKKQLNKELQEVEGLNDKAAFKIYSDIKKIEAEITDMHQYLYERYSEEEVEQMSAKLVAYKLASQLKE